MIEKIVGMNAVIEGDGKPLLMLHGYLSNKELFQKQIEFFSQYFKVIAPDFIGFGGQKMNYPFSLDDYKNSINRLIGALNVESLHVLAHSFGARVVLKMLPENKKVDKVVLTGAAGLKPKKSVKTKIRIAKFKILKKFLPKSRLKSYGSSDYLALDDVMRQSFVKIVNENLDYRLKDITNQVLIIEGENDKETPMYMAKRFEKLLPNAQLVVMNGCGHFAFIDKPHEFNLIVKEFLL